MPNPISFDQLVQQGNPAQEAIKGIELLEKTIKESAGSISTSANKIVEDLKKVNVTTKQGREATQKAATETKKLSERQKELDRLEKALARTKQQLVSVNSKQNKEIIRNRAEVNKANREIRLNTTLTNSQKGSYNQLSASLSINTARWKAMTDTERKNTAQGRRLTKTIKQQTAELKRRDAQIGKSQRNVGNYASAFTSLGAAMGVTMGAAGIFMVLKNATGIIIGFEKEMAKVRAISGATAEEFSKLEKLATDLGGSTLFTAEQVAQLETEYAKLGFSTQEIINATAATLDLAVATDSELAAAAETAGNSLRAFGLDATEMNRVVDVMAASFTSSALNLERWSESMKFAAPIAKAAGVSIEQTAAMAAKLADAGLSGSIAGNALKKIFSELKQEGVPLQDTLSELASQNIGLAEAENLVGERAKAALLVLLDNVDGLKDLTTEFENAEGAGRQMAAVMEDTVAAKITLLGSAWDGLILKMSGSEGTSALGKFVGTVTTFLERFTTVVEFGLLNTEEKVKEYYKNQEQEQESFNKGFLDVQTKFNEDYSEATREERQKELLSLKQNYEEGLKTSEGYFAKEIEGRLSFVNEQLQIIGTGISEEIKKEEEKQALLKKIRNQEKELFLTGIERELFEIDKKAAELKKQGIEEVVVARWVASEKRKIKDRELTEEQKLEREADELSKEIDEEFLDWTDEKLDKETEATEKALDKMSKDRAEATQEDIDEQKEQWQQYLSDLSAIINQQAGTLTNPLAVAFNELANSIVEFQKIAADETLENWQKTYAQIGVIISAIGAIGNAVFANRLTQIDEELDATRRAREYELELAQGNAEKEAQINKKYNAEERKLKTDRAKSEKNAALFTAIINTALGVTQALASSPPPFSFILAALVGAAGAVQIGAIASKPLPKFEKGGHGMVNEGHGKLHGDRHSAKSGGIPVGVAEDGEYFGVINRGKTQKYQDVLPQVFDSLNNGNFENIWQNTNESFRDEYGKKMYGELQKKETLHNGRRIIKNGNRTLYLN